jgi:hypothetical protein
VEAAAADAAGVKMSPVVMWNGDRRLQTQVWPCAQCYHTNGAAQHPAYIIGIGLQLWCSHPAGTNQQVGSTLTRPLAHTASSLLAGAAGGAGHGDHPLAGLGP